MLAAACSSEPAAEPEPPAVRPSQAACDRARSILEAEAASGLLYEPTGEAMIERVAWLRMEQEQRDRLMESLADLAACNAPTPQREVEVSIRSEAGALLAERRVRPGANNRSRR